jgi:hypothetical protein
MGANVVYRAKVPSAIVGTTAVTTVETQFLDAAGNPLKVYLPGSYRISGQMFEIVVAGRAKGGSTYNFTLNLAYGVSATYSSNTTVATSSTVAAATTYSPFLLHCKFVWDSVGQKLFGVSGDGFFGSTPTIHTKAVTTAVSTVDLTADATGLGFTLTGTWGTSHADNAAYITQFDLKL